MPRLRWGLAAVSFGVGLSAMGSLEPEWPEYEGEPLVMAGAVDLSAVPPIDMWRAKPSEGWLCLFVPADGSIGWLEMLAAMENDGRLGAEVGPGGHAVLRVVDDLGFDPATAEFGTHLLYEQPVSGRLLGASVGWSLPSPQESSPIGDAMLELDSRADVQMFGNMSSRLCPWISDPRGTTPFLMMSDDTDHAVFMSEADIAANRLANFLFSATPS